MRLLGLLTAVAALTGATTADACCFFKCWGKGSRAVAAPAASEMTTGAYGGGLVITYVGGQPVPANGVIPIAVNANQDIPVVVEGPPPCVDKKNVELVIAPIDALPDGLAASVKATTVCRYDLTILAGQVQSGGKYYKMYSRYKGDTSGASNSLPVYFTTQ
jgi:hypothetical protein